MSSNKTEKLDTLGFREPNHQGEEEKEDTHHDLENIRRFNRTPRPYFKDGDHVQQDAIPTHSIGPYEKEVRRAGATIDGTQYASLQTNEHSRWRDNNSRVSPAGSESGTEADDERPHFVRGLPAAILRPRKGLKTGEQNDEVLLTPAQLDDDGRPLREEYWAKSQADPLRTKTSADDLRAEAEKLQRRRYAEFLRRISEVALMGITILVVLCGDQVARHAWRSRYALSCHIFVIVGLVIAYPLKLSVVDTRAAKSRLWERFRVPASFDPATVLYPPLLPVLVALSISSVSSGAILPNIILGLSSLPQRLFPRSSRLGGFNSLHWLVSILPLIVSQRFDPATLGIEPQIHLSSETLVSLYPLHHAMLSPLMYITQTSLLISESHLCSAALINLLLLAESPQIVMLKACLWVGGVSLFAICGPVLRWYLALVRVPKWKLRRSGHTDDDRNSMIDAVSALINLQRAAGAFTSSKAVDSDADEDDAGTFEYSPSKTLRSLRNPTFDHSDRSPSSPIEANDAESGLDAPNGGARESSDGLHRKASFLSFEPVHAISRHASARQKRKANLHWVLQLTVKEAQLRKRLYTAFFYAATVSLVLGPVQYYVYEKALARQNPILWAVGYMAGQLSFVRVIFDSVGYQKWATWPPLPPGDLYSISLSWPISVEDTRVLLGAANVRLLLVVYWAIVLVIGLLSVFSLTAFVEVDTRRKVFHGVMVAMILPSAFVDPCCCALALILILTVFLLLEVIRAGQVPPLGNAIGHFVAPYVDGRDLRGPVVVSHIFLLIGCAIPLWFSLASIRREGGKPWVDWELVGNQREVAMVAGVICVGMGDAAASLIGRRYGKHKWLWVGGKSLEGSAAFAVAVTIGLMATKIWQIVGGWQDSAFGLLAGHTGTNGPVPFVLAWSSTLVKAVFCACSASFMEAVLTGANDNVVVPIALWLFVKGCRI